MIKKKVGLVIELTSGKIIFLIGLAKWIKDGAKSVYESVCRIECNEGYELSGSEERKCIVSEYGFMDWSGIASHCVGEKIRLRLIFNNHSDHHNTFLRVLTLSSIHIP